MYSATTSSSVRYRAASKGSSLADALVLLIVRTPARWLTLKPIAESREPLLDFPDDLAQRSEVGAAKMTGQLFE